MNKTTTRILLWSLCLCFTSLAWGNTNSASSDTLPPQLIQRKATGTRLISNAVLLQASGGDEYQWSTGATTSSINIDAPTSPQKYTVHIKRKKTAENWVIQKTVYPANYTNTLASQKLDCPDVNLHWRSRVCAGESVRIYVSGGLSYKWSTNETTSSIIVVPTGSETYSVTVKGINDCEETLNITQPIEVIPVPIAKITVSNNECSVIGAILTASGGESYLWAEGQTTQSIVTEEAVLYEVRVSNGNGLCTDTESIWVTTNFKPEISGDAQLCQGQGTTLTATGGNSYLWATGATSSSITVLPTDVGTHSYKVQVTAGICSREVSRTITVKAKPAATILGPDKACYNGSITLSSSGTGTYKWSTGATTSSISPSLLQSNQTYGLTITDPITQCTGVDEHTVNVLPRPTLNETPNSICAGANVNLSVSGGSSYSWNVGGTTASIVHSPSSSTEYRVTVTDANGCVYSLSKTVNVSGPPNITFGGGTSICAGQSLNITAFGGSSYNWSYNNANTATITVSPVVNTTYTVTATSSGGCVSTAQRVITVKPSPNGGITGAGSICPGQSATLTATGGSSYSWNVGATTASITVSPTQTTNYTVSITNVEGCTVVKSHAIAVNISGLASNNGPLTCTQTTSTLLGSSSAQGATYRWKNASGVEIANTPSTTVITPGVYTLEISAAGGCTFTTATEVLLDRQIPVVSASNAGVITCTQPSINLLGSSSLSPASYEWRNASGALLASTLNASTTQAGTYTLKVTAANGCSATASTVVTADVATPQVTIQHDGPLTCTKTSVTLSANPNNPNLQYTWRNSGGSIIASNSSSVVVTATGTYQLEALGSNGCSTTVGATITQSGNFPNISVNNPGSISCISPSATISGNSTTPGVSYAWYNPNGKLMSTQKSFSANIAGTYTLKVTSAEGCVSSASTTLGETIFDAQRTTLNVGGSYTNSNFAQGELTCTQNSVSMSASARFAGYSISVYWTNAAGTVLSTTSQLTVSSPGYYYLKQNDCPLVKEILIKENRPLPVVQIAGEKLACVGKNTTLTASGGSQYSWNTGATSASIITENIYSPTTYTVTVSTGTYCSTVANVTVSNYPNMVINIAGPTSLCAGTFVTLTASGGYTYKWSHNNATTESINVAPLVPSTYTVTATSDKGCTATKTHVISTVKSQPNDFNLNGLPTAAFCGEAPLNISVINPNSNYTWAWSTGETTTFLQTTLTSSQTVSVTATRNNGCTRTKTIPITVNPKPAGLIQGAEIDCAGGSTILTAPAGESYLWSTNATTSSISIQPASDQTYRVTVSNAGGTCSASFEKRVTVPVPLSLSHDLAGDDDCIPNNAAVIPIVSGGTGSIALGIIRSGELYASPNLDGLPSGTYVLRAEDTRGCLALDEVVIAETPTEISALTLSKVDDCIPGNTQLNISTKGDRLPLVYRLDGVVITGPTFTLPRTEGEHLIEVEDAAGCKSSQSNYYLDYDAIKIEQTSPVTDCNTPNGAIFMVYQGNKGSLEYGDYSLSADGGVTWNDEYFNLIKNLRPGTYTTAFRLNKTGCIAIGPQVQITAPNCLPEAGFTKDTLMVRSPTQRIALPWRVDKRAWGNADKPFSLRIYREGDGKPHFVDPNVATLLEPEEKNRGLAGQVIEYGVDFEGNDELVLTLQPEAGDYLEPGIYTFSLEASDGLKIDPLRQQLRVFVVLDPTTTIGGLPECSEATITLTAPEESECYIWEGVTARTDERTVRVPYKSGAVYKVHMVKDLKTKTHVFFAEDLISPFEINAKDAAGKTIYDKKVCPGERIQLVVSSKANSNSSDWTFTWETLSNTGENYVTLAKTTTFLATAHNRVKNCSLSQEITIEVEDAGFVDPKFKPSPLVFCHSYSTYPGKNVEIEVTNPVEGVTYSWHIANSQGGFQAPIIGTKAQVNLFQAAFGPTGNHLKMSKQVADGHLCEKKINLNISTGQLQDFIKNGGDYYSLQLASLSPQADKAYQPIGSGGTVEFVGTVSDYNIQHKSNFQSPVSSLKASLETAIQSRFANHSSKKVFVIDESAVCEEPGVISKALELIQQYEVGFIILRPFSQGGNGSPKLSILASYNGKIITPLSSGHSDFLEERLNCVEYLASGYSAANLVEEVLYAMMNYYTVEIQAEATEDLCSSTLVLKPKVESIIGTQTYKYKWSNGSTSSSITVTAGLNTETYTLTVTDTKINPDQRYDGHCGPVGTFDLEPSNSNACAILKYFEQQKDNFFSIPITVQASNKIRSSEPELREDPCSGYNEVVVNAAGSVNFEIYGTGMSSNALVTSVGTTLAQFSSIFGYKNARAIITSNESFCKCDNYQSVIDAFLDGAELGFWFHIFSPKNSPDVACAAFTGGDDKLYIQARFTGGPIFPGGPGDVDYLRMMEEYLKNKSLSGPKMISHLQREMLPEVSEAKTPQVFDKEDPEKNKLPKEQSPDDRCRMGFNAASINVIVPSGHVVALPANSVARFDHNPLTVNKFANGVVTGFTIFKNGKPVQIYHSFNKRSTPDHIGFFAAEEESPVSGAGYPFGVPEKNADGDVDLTVGYFIQEKRPNYNCNEFFDIKSALIQPTKPLISRPFGTLIKQLPEAGKIHKEQNKAFYPICSGVKLGETVAQLEASGGGDLTAILDYNSSTPGIYYRFTDPLTRQTVWLYVTKKDGQTYYWTWNCVLAGWLQYTDPIDAESIIKIERLNKLLNSQVLKQGIHNALDIIGFVPVLGDIADLANASLYAIEGNWTQAGISVAFIIAPNLLKAGRYIKGAGKWLSKAGVIGGSVKAVYKFVDCATVAGEPELRSTPECQIAVKILNQAIENLNKAEVSPTAIDKIIGILEKSLDDVNLSGLDDISEKLITWFNASPDKVADFCKIVAKGVDDVQLPDADLLKLVDDLVGNPGFFDALKGNNGLVRAWKIAQDGGRSSIRLAESSLTTIDEIVSAGKLGFSNAAAMVDFLKKPWDNIDGVMTALKRASDANVPGMTVKYKKFPAPSDGSYSYVLGEAKKFQAGSSGDANLSFELNGTSFDDVLANGTLIDRKFGHGNSIFDEVLDEFGEIDIVIRNPTRVNSILEQAKRQIISSGGRPIRWEISTPLGANGIRSVFSDPLLVTNPNFQNINFSLIQVVNP